MMRSDDNDNNCLYDYDCMLIYILTFFNFKYLFREEHSL